MLVRVNPDRLAADENFVVHHPVTGRPFPSPDPFDMPATDVDNPRVLRLFAKPSEDGGLPGGVFGDLVAVSAEAAVSSTTKKKG